MLVCMVHPAPWCLRYANSYDGYYTIHIHRLHELPLLVTNWSGPLSIAVFGPDKELGVAVHYIRYLRSCHPSIRSQVTFHLVYPVDHPGTVEVNIGDVGISDCHQRQRVLKVYFLTSANSIMSPFRVGAVVIDR